MSRMLLVLTVVVLLLCSCGDRSAIDRAKARKIDAEAEGIELANDDAEQKLAQKQADWMMARQLVAAVAGNLAIVLALGLGFGFGIFLLIAAVFLWRRMSVSAPVQSQVRELPMPTYGRRQLPLSDEVLLLGAEGDEELRADFRAFLIERERAEVKYLQGGNDA